MRWGRYGVFWFPRQFPTTKKSSGIHLIGQPSCAEWIRSSRKIYSDSSGRLLLPTGIPDFRNAPRARSIADNVEQFLPGKRRAYDARLHLPARQNYALGRFRCGIEEPT